MANYLTNTTDSIFQLSTIPQNKVNLPAMHKVKTFLPEIEQKTKAFDRQNSQTTLSLMTLTMLNGQSPMRMIRQVMAEIEKRKMALAEAQVTHAETLKEIQELEHSSDLVDQARFRHKCIVLDMLESKINGSFKDIATLIDQYNNIKTKHNVDDWDEEAYEREEKRHHVRRGFELMYRNLIESGRAHISTIEYLQQYGVHPQVAITEVSGYIKYTADRIARKDIPHSNDLENFLDQMADKYYSNADLTAERLFGTTNVTNPEYMLRLERKEE